MAQTTSPTKKTPQALAADIIFDACVDGLLAHGALDSAAVNRMHVSTGYTEEGYLFTVYVPIEGAALLRHMTETLASMADFMLACSGCRVDVVEQGSLPVLSGSNILTMRKL